MAQSQLGSLFAMLRANGSARYDQSPAFGGAGVGGVELTTGNAAWGNYSDLAAASAITVEFWLAGLTFYVADTAQNYQVEVADATPTAKFGLETGVMAAGITPTWSTSYIPIPLYMAAGSQVQARAGGAGNGKKITCRLIYLRGV